MGSVDDRLGAAGAAMPYLRGLSETRHAGVWAPA